MSWDFCGAPLRLEPRQKQIQLVNEIDRVDTVMIDAPDISRFLDRDIDGDTLAANVIVTTTFADDQLEFWFPERLQKVVNQFGADAVVPCDCPVYQNDPEGFRRETVQNYADDLTQTIPEFREMGVEVIPLVKGESPYERGICYDVFDDHGIRGVADYAAQYFSYGYRFPQLRTRLHRIENEYKPSNMMLIGVQSENLVPELPLSVTSVAGKRWLRRINFANGPKPVTKQQLNKWLNEIEAALSRGQTTLSTFYGERGWA
jgi:hypothetical protein